MVMPVSVVTWHILRRRVLALPGQEQQVWEKHRHQQSLNAKIRAKVEHPFRVLKCQFNFRKVRYKGLAQNIAFIIGSSGFPYQCRTHAAAFTGGDFFLPRLATYETLAYRWPYRSDRR